MGLALGNQVLVAPVNALRVQKMLLVILAIKGHGNTDRICGWDENGIFENNTFFCCACRPNNSPKQVKSSWDLCLSIEAINECTSQTKHGAFFSQTVFFHNWPPPTLHTCPLQSCQHPLPQMSKKQIQKSQSVVVISIEGEEYEKMASICRPGINIYSSAEKAADALVLLFINHFEHPLIQEEAYMIMEKGGAKLNDNHWVRVYTLDINPTGFEMETVDVKPANTWPKAEDDF